VRKLLTPPQLFVQQCAAAFEALAAFNNPAITPSGLQDATLAVSLSGADRPEALAADAQQQIARALHLHEKANIPAVLNVYFEAAELAEASVEAAKPHERAVAKIGMGASADEHFFQMAYAASCAQAAARLAHARADQGDRAGVEAVSLQFEGAIATLHGHPTAVACRLLSSKTEGVAQKLERAQLAAHIPQAPKAKPSAM
jgi:hypothetical protein